MGLEWTRVATVGKDGAIEVRVPVLPEGSIVEVVIRRESNAPTKQRIFGYAKGQGMMSANFDEPLAEFNKYR